MRKSDLFFNVLRLPVDFLMLILAGLATYFLRTEILSAFRPVLFQFNLPLLKYLYLVTFVSLLFIGSFAVSGLYSMKIRRGVADEFFKIMVASSAGIMIIIVYIFLRQELFDSRFLVMGGWFFANVFVFTGRVIVRWVQSVISSKHDFGIHKLILIGTSQPAIKIAAEIKGEPASGYRILSHISSSAINEVESAITNLGADEVILVDSNFSQEEIGGIIELCQERHIIFKFVPAVSHVFSSNFDLDVFKGLPLVEIKRTKLEGWGRVIKRVIDILGALLGLILFSPIFLAISLAIKWETEGPVFVRLKRVSGTKELELLKFRSMVSNAEELKPYLAAFNERTDGPLFKMRLDPRITSVGRFIRKFRIDELPQFWNILAGDISLVGPRPHQPDEIALYKRHQKKVLAIKAGATGLAQVSGSSDLSFDKEVALDSFYIENWSFWLDVKIILKTIIKMVSDRSAV